MTGSFNPVSPEPGRARSWLAHYGCYADDDVIAVLSHCADRREVGFLINLLTLPGWYTHEGRYFQHPHYQLFPSGEIAGYKVSFLFRSRTSKRIGAIDIESANPLLDGAAAAARSDAIHANGGIYIRFGESTQFSGEQILREVFKQEVRASRDDGDLRSPWHRKPLVQKVPKGGFDWSSLTYEERLPRCIAWLGHRNSSLDKQLVAVLANCTTSSQLSFALPVLQALPWRILNRRTITDGRNEVRFQQKMGSRRIDFLFGPRDAKNSELFAVDVVSPVRGKRILSDEYVAEAVARTAGFHYERLNPEDAFSRGQAWAHLLGEANSERRDKFKEWSGFLRRSDETEDSTQSEQSG